MLEWPAKDPQDVFDYYLDVSKDIVEGDTIVSVDVTANGTVTIDSSQFDALTHIIRADISGGTHGEMVEVVMHVTTTEGREFDKTCYLPIRDNIS